MEIWQSRVDVLTTGTEKYDNVPFQSGILMKAQQDLIYGKHSLY